MNAIHNKIISNAFRVVNVCNFVKRKQSQNQYKLFYNSLSPDLKEIVDMWNKIHKEFHKEIKGK